MYNKTPWKKYKRNKVFAHLGTAGCKIKEEKYTFYQKTILYFMTKYSAETKIYTSNMTINGKLDLMYSQVNAKGVMVIMHVVKSHNTN